jgi:hypothetical protein
MLLRLLQPLLLLLLQVLSLNLSHYSFVSLKLILIKWEDKEEVTTENRR